MLFPVTVGELMGTNECEDDDDEEDVDWMGREELCEGAVSMCVLSLPSLNHLLLP